jgi:hypothetical protein
MNTKKFFIGTLAGGIAFFLLGYLFYGLALYGFFNRHSTAAAGSMKQMSDIVWWALILGNFASGALITYVLLKLGNIGSPGSGASTGAAIGFFVSLSMDLIHYATSNSFDLTAMVVDVLVGTVMYAIVGGIIGALIGRGKTVK